MEERKPAIVIAHVMYSYLTQSETFIWQYLHNFRRVTPVIIAKKLENLDQFPITNGHIRPIYGRMGLISWFIDIWYRRVLKMPFSHIPFRRIERIIHKEKIRLIHAHFGPLGCACLPLSHSVPLITNFYGYDLFVKDVVENYHDAYMELFKKGWHFLVEGPHMRNRVISLGCPKEKISIQRIALHLVNYKFKPRIWDGKRPIRLLFVGRFVEKKGLEYAIRALGKIKRGYCFQFRIIGGGSLEERLHALSSNLGLSEKIVWLGIQAHRRVIEEIQSCDILIQPSVTAHNGDSEGGAPTIILEAQACGLPVISTTHADIPYIVCPNESALLSPERDVNSLANNISHLLDNSESWHRMGKIGREHVEKFHDIRKEVIALENIYKDCLMEEKLRGP